MIFKLHTKSTRKYRGKYPTRLHDFSNGGQRGNPIVARHLAIRSPHFLELNDGRRYYVDGFWLNDFKLPILTKLLFKYDFEAIVAHAVDLPAKRYDEMLGEINAERARARDEHNAAVRDRKHARDRAQARASIDVHVPLDQATIDFIKFCEDQHGAQRREHEPIASYIARLEGNFK
jgi:hypothetical protein